MGAEAVGIGDELIACGQAKEIHARTGKRVEILDRHGARRSHEIWNGVPFIAHPSDGGRVESVQNCPGVRPYIAAKTLERWTWRDYQCTPGEIVLTERERELGRQYHGRIIVEPHNKARASPNKQWGWVRWNKLAWLLGRKGIRVTQLGPAGTQTLEGVDLVVTRSFRDACGVLSTARACVLPEGGLHHAAAALNVPSVVIYGGFISPAQTGYALHANLFTGGEACGMRQRCRHCTDAMAAISPEAVAQQLQESLNRETTSRNMAA